MKKGKTIIEILEEIGKDCPPYDEQDLEEFAAMDRYEEHFGEVDFDYGFLNFSTEEFVKLIDLCIKADKRMYEIIGEPEKGTVL